MQIQQISFPVNNLYSINFKINLLLLIIESLKITMKCLYQDCNKFIYLIYAAIDIGSNAVRLLIQESKNSSQNEVYFQKISLTRIPLRLGKDVFSKGKINEASVQKLIKVFKVFKLVMEINDVECYRACATSAMREAETDEAQREKSKPFELGIVVLALSVVAPDPCSTKCNMHVNLVTQYAPSCPPIQTCCMLKHESISRQD